MAAGGYTPPAVGRARVVTAFEHPHPGDQQLGCPHPVGPNYLLGAQPVTGFVNRAISSSPSSPPSSSLPCLFSPPFYIKVAQP